jgi:signal transduction histidine kinase
MKIKRQPLVIFYLLVGYIFASFIWWMFFLVKSSSEAYQEKKELTQLNYKYENKTSDAFEKSAAIQAIHNEYRRKLYMIISEGSVFLIILLVVTWKMNQSLQREYKLNLQQKNFLLSITHELRSPIASSKVAMQTLAKRHDLPRDKVDLLLHNSLNDMERLQGLVENILLAAKIEDHTFQIGNDACDLSEITNYVIEKAADTTAGNRRIDIDIKPEVLVIGDRMGLTSVITNLIENAIKYSTDASIISISLFDDGDRVIFKIADNGLGIPDTEKKKIFQKFYRIGQEETRKTKGTGLGLYIVDRILELHKGKVSVRDNDPQGSIFEVVLPKSA